MLLDCPPGAARKRTWLEKLPIAAPPPTKVTTAPPPRVNPEAVRMEDEPGAGLTRELIVELEVSTELPALMETWPTLSVEAAPVLPTKESSPAFSVIPTPSRMRLPRLAPKSLSMMSAEPVPTVKLVVLSAVPWSRRISEPEALLTVVEPL